MRKRVLSFFLAVSMFLALTPDTVMAAKMEEKSLHIHETAQQTEPVTETEAVPEAAGSISNMEGAGTETEPYRIQNAGQLRIFADIVNGVNGVPDTKLCAILMCDIDLTGVCGAEIGSWTPIGTDANPYAGTFDGGAFTITGLYCHNPKSSCVGLFGRNAGIIKNLGIAGADIAGDHYTGGVCGYNNGIITGCYHAATVKGANYTGGICGCNDSGGTVSVCYNTGVVSGRKYVGGICGYNKNNAADCYNMGTVNGDSTSIGGVCGYNKASVSNCFNAGAVNGGRKKYIGSVCGYNHSKSTFLNCYYLIMGEEKGNYGVAMSQERFTSGEVCWLLNGGKSENVIWYQTCGAGFPTFGGKTVYQVQRQKAGGRADEMIVAYTNENQKRQAVSSASAQKNTSEQNADNYEHEHSYQEPEWEWEEYKAAKAVFICQDCGEELILEATISKSMKAATCAKEGETVYQASVDRDGTTYQDEKSVKTEKLSHQTPLAQITAKSATCEESGISQECWKCQACGKYFEDEQGTKEIPKRQVVVPATGHHYVQNGSWIWNIDSDPDSNPVRASLNFICDNPGCDETETKEAKVTSKTDATCTKAGETTYTAVISFNNEKYEDVKIVSGKPIPHSFGKPVWEWKDDFTAEATFICTKCKHSETKPATIEEKTTNPTCLKEGEIAYQATVTFEGRDYVCPEVKKQTLAKTQHSYTTAPQWKWSADFSACTAMFTCDICRTSSSVKADVTETSTPGTDCGTPGKITYTATVNFQNKNFTCPDSPMKEMPAAHTLNLVPAVLPKCETNGNEEYWKCSVCQKLFADAAGAKQLADVPVIPATGHTLEHVKDNIYQCTICGGTYQVTVTSNGTTRITSVESEGVITQDTSMQVDSEEEQKDAASQSSEEQDSESETEPVKEEPSPQSDAEEKQEEGADQSAGEQIGESNQEKQNEQIEEECQDKQSGEDGENVWDGQSESRDGIMDASEHAARYGLIYPEREAGKEEYTTADVREENVVKLRAESKGNAATQMIQNQRESSLWGAVVVLFVAAGAVLTLLYKGRRIGNRK